MAEDFNHKQRDFTCVGQYLDYTEYYSYAQNRFITEDDQKLETLDDSDSSNDNEFSQEQEETEKERER